MSARGRRISQRGYIQQARRNASRQRQILRRIYVQTAKAVREFGEALDRMASSFDLATASGRDLERIAKTLGVSP